MYVGPPTVYAITAVQGLGRLSVAGGSMVGSS